MENLNTSAMLAWAEYTTGLSDWGGEEFREPFELLVRAINEEARLNAQGLARARQHLQQRLCQRLSLFDDRKLRPEIVAQRIDRPLFVVGLPRAGTTYTHALLGADPANAAPLGWQLMLPSPPPNDPAIDHASAIREAQAIVDYQGWSSPQVKSAHDYGAIMQPEECYRAFELSFHTMSFTGAWNIPSYFAALATRDSTPAYEIHKKVLQALQVGVEGRRWMLKAPEHTTQLEALLKVYPDAMLVQNHRDPSRVIASVMSLYRMYQSLSTDHVPEVTREFTLTFMRSFAQAQEQLIRIRKDPEVNRHFIDVSYLDLERDPLAVMKRIYALAGMPFNEVSSKAISGWIETNRKGRHGKHRYRLADISVTQEEIHGMFQRYIEHFNIELEPAA